MAREVYATVQAGNPRGSWPAEEKAAELSAQGQPATVVMDLDSDSFLVVPAGES
jgi:hypothetical protein